MNSVEQQPPPGGHPTVVQQTTVIQVGSQKSVGGAVVLAFFFGPLGMLYSTVVGACVMFVVNIVVFIGTAGLGLLVTIPIGMIWAGSAASSHNNSLGAATRAIAQPVAQFPPAWHPDPDGSDRLRYWDGQRWTDHYSQPSTPAPNEAPAHLAASVGDSPTDTSDCLSCGETIAAGHRFCPACGTAR
jgi:hypothetical protein